MSESGTEEHHLERTKLLYQSIFARDWEVAKSILSPSVVVREPDSLPYGGDHHGHEGFVNLMKDVAAHWERLRPREFVYTASGDIVHMETTLVGTARATGKAVQLPFLESWTFENGLIVRGIIYYFDTHLVREALALMPSDSGTKQK